MVLIAHVLRHQFGLSFQRGGHRKFTTKFYLLLVLCCTSLLLLFSAGLVYANTHKYTYIDNHTTCSAHALSYTFTTLLFAFYSALVLLTKNGNVGTLHLLTSACASSHCDSLLIPFLNQNLHTILKICIKTD